MELKYLGLMSFLIFLALLRGLNKDTVLIVVKKRDFRDYFQVSSLISVSVNPPLIVQDLGKGDSGE